MFILHRTIDEARNEAHKQYNHNLGKYTVVVFKDDNQDLKYKTVVDPDRYPEYRIKAFFNEGVYRLIGKGE